MPVLPQACKKHVSPAAPSIPAKSCDLLLKPGCGEVLTTPHASCYFWLGRQQISSMSCILLGITHMSDDACIRSEPAVC